VYAVEDAFEHLPVHWMWWPALGAVVVGVVGFLDPRTLGVGYANIEGVLTGSLAGRTLLFLIVLKFISWLVYLGSGTSGGTLAPLFTIGGGAGALMGGVLSAAAPALAVDVHVAGLVGMAAIFAGASHALLASVVFAFETTRQPMGLLPLLAGCSAAYLTSLLLSRTSIMTEKLARRGSHAATEYASDFLAQVRVGEVASREVLTLAEDDRVGDIRDWMHDTTHQGFPVVDDAGEVRGVLTRRDLLDPDVSRGLRARDLVKRRPVVVYEHNTLREAADHMVEAGVGRLVVVSSEEPRTLVGIVTRSDLLNAHARRLQAARRRHVVLRPLGRVWPGGGAS
jgi:chloride channel protein, CIC family